MRVGLIIYESINETTGGYIYDYKLVEYLRSKGVNVKIFSQEKKSFGSLVKQNFSKKITNEIIEFSPDILLQDGMNFISLFILNKKLKKIGNFTIISITHLLQVNALHSFLDKLIIRKIEHMYLKSVDGFIFNSISTEKSIKKIIGNNRNSLIAYPGKDRLQIDCIKESFEFKFQNKKLMIIFIGNLFYNKGLHILLQALSKIDSNLWQLSIVGGLHFDSKYTQKIFSMITALKLENNIKIHGTLEIQKLKKELLAHHVLIVPSYFESYGIVYTEAMGAGIPVIASDTGGVSEIVKDTCNGFLIPPGDTIMLRNNIIKLITNRNLLIKMSFSSLSAYKKFPTWDETMDKVYVFLNQIYNSNTTLKKWF